MQRATGERSQAAGCREIAQFYPLRTPRERAFRQRARAAACTTQARRSSQNLRLRLSLNFHGARPPSGFSRGSALVKFRGCKSVIASVRVVTRNLSPMARIQIRRLVLRRSEMNTIALRNIDSRQVTSSSGNETDRAGKGFICGDLCRSRWARRRTPFHPRAAPAAAAEPRARGGARRTPVSRRRAERA